MTKPLWDNEGPKPTFPARGILARLYGAIRGLLLVLTLFGGLALMLVMRLIEAPLFGKKRPVTPHFVQFICKVSCWLLGLRIHPQGTLETRANALVANHSSWLDIFVLNQCGTGYFVSKSEVSKWMGIGWLAQATGTIFVERRRSQAQEHRDLLAKRLQLGHRLIFFPEGTSTDGLQVLPFKSTLFDALRTDQAMPMVVQPVSIYYRPPDNLDPRAYGWWGHMSFAPHLFDLLCTIRRGDVFLQFHEPIKSTPEMDRKQLAKACGNAVTEGHSALMAAHQPMARR